MACSEENQTVGNSAEQISSSRTKKNPALRKREKRRRGSGGERERDRMGTNRLKNI